MHKVKSNKKFIVLLMVALVFAISICYTVLANAEEDEKMLPEESTAVEVDKATEQSTTVAVPEEPRQAPVNIPAGDNQNGNGSVFYPGFQAEEGGSVSAGAMRCITEENHYVLSFGSDNVVRAIFPTEGWGEVKEVTPNPDDGYKFDAWYDNNGKKIDSGEHGYSVGEIFTAKFIKDEPALVPIHVACDEQYLSDADIWNLVNTYDWKYDEGTKTWSNAFSNDTTYADAMEGWKNVKPEKEGYTFKGFNPEPDDKHFLTEEITFNPIFEKSAGGKTITFITGDFKEAWGNKILAVFYNEEGVTEQHEMATTEAGIFLTEIEKDESTHVKFVKNEPVNKEIDAGEIPNVENPTFILTSENEGEWYKEPEPPKPDPQPDPSSDTSSGSTSSNASGSAQTGDMTYVVVGSLMLCALGAGVLAIRKRREF